MRVRDWATTLRARLVRDWQATSSGWRLFLALVCLSVGIQIFLSAAFPPKSTVKREGTTIGHRSVGGRSPAHYVKIELAGGKVAEVQSYRLWELAEARGDGLAVQVEIDANHVGDEHLDDQITEVRYAGERIEIGPHGPGDAALGMVMILAGVGLFMSACWWLGPRRRPRRRKRD